MTRLHPASVLRGTVALVALASGAAAAQGTWSSCTTERASLGTGGVEADGDSIRPALSPDGNLVAFCSRAHNLRADGNRFLDVYLHDRAAGTTQRVSLPFTGSDTDGVSLNPVISGFGRYVAFHSDATNLVAADGNGTLDVFVFDRLAASTFLASVHSDGTQGDGASQDASISAGGRLIVFTSQSTNLDDLPTGSGSEVYVHDRLTGATARVSVRPDGGAADGLSRDASLSADGRFVAFTSVATDLVPADGNGREDVFVRDLATGATTRVSVAPGGGDAQGDSSQPAISADGRFVAFSSTAPDLVEGDTNGAVDVFVHDRAAGTTERVSIGSGGEQGDGLSGRPGISADGRFVSFNSTSSTLVAGDDNGTWDAFGHDRRSHETWRAGEVLDGFGLPREPVISADGRHIAFSSIVRLVADDVNGLRDVYVTSCETEGPFRYCPGKPNSLGCTPSISFIGVPSAGGGGFQLLANGVVSHTSGLLVYSTTGLSLTPLGDGLLCIANPLVRTAGRSSRGGPPPADCSGGYAFDFGAWIQSGQDPALVPGRTVWAQYWMRDTGHPLPNSFALSSALEFTILP